jgi:hypothetical protein
MRAGAGADSVGRCGLQRASSSSSLAQPWQILGSSVGGTSPPWRRPLLLPSGTMDRRSLVLRGRSCSTISRVRPGARRLAGCHARPPGGRRWCRSSRSQWGRASIPPTMASNGGSCGHGLIGERMHPYSSEELTHGGARRGRARFCALRSSLVGGGEEERGTFLRGE